MSNMDWYFAINMIAGVFLVVYGVETGTDEVFGAGLGLMGAGGARAFNRAS